MGTWQAARRGEHLFCVGIPFVIIQFHLPNIVRANMVCSRVPVSANEINVIHASNLGFENSTAQNRCNSIRCSTSCMSTREHPERSCMTHACKFVHHAWNHNCGEVGIRSTVDARHMTFNDGEHGRKQIRLRLQIGNDRINGTNARGDE